MNRYPIWKFVLIGTVFIIGLLYTIPNFFGESPAVQISPAKTSLKLDESLLQKVESTLKLANIPFDGLFMDASGVKVRFANTDTQLLAKDKLVANLGKDYTVALNLVPQTPNWLQSI
ncbi:MAG TPA: protein translocase subunit SecD, partial [Methylophilus sp.]|nr:protein translocase subunit SecD [Methylophilus sp.]